MSGEREFISKAHMRAVDRLYWSPQERAMGVHALITSLRDHLREENKKHHLPEGKDVPSDWDLFCYACEYAGMQALIINEEELIGISVALNRWLYSAHYSNPGRLYGQPDKPKALREQKEEEKDGESPTSEGDRGTDVPPGGEA